MRYPRGPLHAQGYLAHKTPPPQASSPRGKTNPTVLDLFPEVDFVSRLGLKLAQHSILGAGGVNLRSDNDDLVSRSGLVQKHHRVMCTCFFLGPIGGCSLMSKKNLYQMQLF